MMSTNDSRELRDDASDRGDDRPLDQLFKQITAELPPADVALQIQGSLQRSVQTLRSGSQVNRKTLDVGGQHSAINEAPQMPLNLRYYRNPRRRRIRRWIILTAIVFIAACIGFVDRYSARVRQSEITSQGTPAVVDRNADEPRGNANSLLPRPEASVEYIPVTLNSGFPLFAQELINGGFEDTTNETQPVGWVVPQVITENGYQLQLQNDHPPQGSKYAVMSCTGAPPSNQAFGNIMQAIEAAPWEGKRVRFSALVKTANLGAGSSGRLWLRVDGDPVNGIPKMLAFDNMDQRPIQNGDWARYEIVADVPATAKTILVGILLIGSGEVSVDDASFTEADAKTASTATGPTAGGLGRGVGAIHPAQSFWSPWLIAVAFCVCLILLSHCGEGPIHKFAFRFAFAYFLLYSFPQPLSSVLPPLALPYDFLVQKVVNFTASTVFSLELPAATPTGSGDTLRDYIRLFLCFALALLSAVLWTVLALWIRFPEWLQSRLKIVLRDGLRTYVRWILAITLLSYGLAKLGTVTNQFPEPGVGQLLKTWGDSSPMNVVWTFMGSSKAYTSFSGWMEVGAALLLIWRRTATLGGLVAAGVMSNVLMLNLCYDVPVKQYSAQLLLMAAFVVLHDWKSLFYLLVRNQSVAPLPVGPTYSEPVLLWFHRGCKTLAILLLIVLRIVAHIRMESSVAEIRSAGSPLLGDYVVESVQPLTVGDQKPDPLEEQLLGSSPWKYITIQTIRTSMFDTNSKSIAVLRTLEGDVTSSSVSLDDTADAIRFDSDQSPTDFSVEKLNDEELVWKSKTVELKLRRIRREDFLLVNRGFRWISEYPYNR